MGQQEILEYLKKNRTKWFSTKELSEKLHISIGSITFSAKKLRKTRFVYFKKVDISYWYKNKK